ncbi:uncharacterized protein CCOS01_03083 [Colletotrichum costaricense]|uniref:Uncharacterized protein n=1 Tax=Colletotrichum costaricense TaxID=1209916 RepID=A0AAI9Z5Y6_9PEZI|nr:uncharacterized protein CCOS01_03083 [Colletotrichum costaricense]KAK1534331.1 hypothetical protein CCOS01_03083 [Colletotrichum costaricense]
MIPISYNAYVQPAVHDVERFGSSRLVVGGASSFKMMNEKDQKKPGSKKTFRIAAKALKGLVSKAAFSLKKSKSFTTLKRLSRMSSRRDRGQHSRSKSANNIDTAGTLEDHNPHRLSIIEEASRESRESSHDIYAANMYDEQGFLSEDHEDIYDLDEFEMMNSNVGPHGQDNGALTHDTVLYGNWEQDNNLHEFNRSSSPETVVFDHARYAGVNLWEVSISTDSESYSRSVHEVPDPSIKIEGIPTTKDWSIFQSKLVDYGADEPSPQLPGCSAGHPFAKEWFMTDSMMKAYDAVRGSMRDASDPLRYWMEVKAFESALRAKRDATKVAVDGPSCQHDEKPDVKGKGRAADGGGFARSEHDEKPEGKGKERAVDGGGFACGEPQNTSKTQPSPIKGAATSGLRADVKREKDDYVKMLDDTHLLSAEYAPDTADRKGAYNVPRPKYLHIAPDFEDFRFEDYLPPITKTPESSFKGLLPYKLPYDPDRNFVEDYGISDDEGDPETGRISPCTFRLLAEGCAEQNTDGKVFMADDAQRMRPETSMDDGPPKEKAPDRLLMEFETQRDINDNGYLTPCYSLDSEPSIIYLPAGVTFQHKMRNWWFGLFDRMNPEVARNFRKIEYHEQGDPPIAPPKAATEDSTTTTEPSGPWAQHYTHSDIETILNTPGARKVAGVEATSAAELITQRQKTILRWKTRDEEVTRENAVLRVDVGQAQKELREMRLSVDHVLAQRAAQERADRERAARELREAWERKAAWERAEKERIAAEELAEKERKAAEELAERERKAAEERAEEERKAAEELAKRQKHEKRVLRRVSAHLHDLRYEVQAKFHSLRDAEDENEKMKKELVRCKTRIMEECSRANLSSPDEVRRAVSQNFRDKMAALDLSG